jgi:hypothetical protein
MALPPRNHQVPRTFAAELIRRHRDHAPDAEMGGVFHGDQVRDLLAQPGCVTFRYYHGIDDDGKPTIILVGVDAEDRDLTDGPMLEMHFPCPPLCSQPNALNGLPIILGRRPYREAPLLLPPRDHRITLEAAARMTRRYRTAAPTGEKAGAFHADQVRALMAQDGCLALRYYHGMHEDGRPAIILVGMDPEGADMTDGVLLEKHYPCPPLCSELNVLNSGVGRAAWTGLRRRSAYARI